MHNPHALPTTASAGLTFTAKLALSAYPATSWEVSALVRGPQAIDLTATGAGCEYTFSASNTVTAGWTAGKYWYQLRAKNLQTGEVREVYNGEIEILPDFEQASAGFDGRSPAEIALQNIDAYLANPDSLDVQRYSLNNREIWRYSKTELIKLRAFFASKVRREKAAKTGTFGRKIPVRFS